MTALPLLEVRHLCKRYGGLNAVTDLDLVIGQRSIHSLIGPNGAGKTTAFNCISQHVTVSSGEIRFAEQRIDGLRPDQVAKTGIARTYQNIRLFKSMTVLENVLVGMHLRLKSRWFEAVLGLRRVRHEEQVARSQARRLLAYVGLGDLASADAASLSYGQQRRLEIARALATQPKLLLLDEPTAGMNPPEVQEMTGFVRRMRDELSISILLIEHQVRMVMAVSDTVTVMHHGAVIANGTPSEIQRDPEVVAAYLGHKR